jgi:hypothetical protein
VASALRRFRTTVEAEPAAPLIGIGAHDLDAAAFGILPDGSLDSMLEFIVDLTA